MTTLAADGSYNVTVVDGEDLVGLFAIDGSMNVVISDEELGAIYHPSGAIRVTVAGAGQVPYYAPDGSLYVTESPYETGGTKVTVVAGSLT